MRIWHKNFNGKNEDWIYLGLPIAISVIIKLILLTALYNTLFNNDATIYINAAKQYAMGNFTNGLAIYPMPAYPMLLALVHLLIPDWILAGYFISIISMILVTIPLYFLTKIMFDNKVAFWTCIVFAVIPQVNEWSLSIIREPLFLLLFISSVYFALRSILEKDFLLFGTTFIFSWLATLIRIEGVVFIGFYFFVLSYLSISDKKNRAGFFIRLLTWVGIPLGIISLVLLFNGLQGIAFSRFDNVYDELIKFFSGGFLIKSSRISAALSEMAPHRPFHDGHYSFLVLCKHYMPLIYALGVMQAIVKILFFSSFIPLYFGLKDRANCSGNSGKFILWILILFAGLAYYVLIIEDYMATRWAMIPAILLLPWIGSGINILFAKANASSHKKLILFLILIIVFAPTIKTFGLISSRDITTAYTLKWLKENNKINKVQIVSNNFKESFYFDLAVQSQTDSNSKIYFYNKRKIKKSIEEFSLEKNASIIIFKVKTNEKGKIPNFHLYQKATSIVGNRYSTFIYCKVQE